MRLHRTSGGRTHIDAIEDETRHASLQIYDDLPELPEPVPTGALASDWVSPTLDNGVALPRADLHIALVTPDRATADLIRGRIRIVRPPLWAGGKILLHIILEDQRKTYRDIDMTVLLAMADLGLIDAADLEIAAPDDETIGYPSGVR